jgi:molybdate transport system substrate-binding protein
LKRIGLALTALAVLALLSGCGKKEDANAPAAEPAAKEAPTRLILYCGAGIRDACQEIITAFEKAHPDIRVSATYAGSGRLLGQLAASRKGDLYMPGSAFYVDKAVEQGLADAGTRTKAAYFIPVLFVQKGNPLGVRSLRDLAAKKLRLGLGDERAVAIGRRSYELFNKNDVPVDAVEKNVVYKSGTVNELGVAVQLKNVDVAIVWDANARQFAAYGDMIEIPRERNIITEIPIVRLSFSRHPEEAAAFVRFVTTDEAKQLFRKNGYTVDLAKEEVQE